MRIFFFSGIMVCLVSTIQAQEINHAPKFSKNHIEIGCSAWNFMDGNGFGFSQMKSRYYPASRISVLGFSYGRVVDESWTLHARYQVFNRYYYGPYSDNALGVLSVYRWSQNVSASATYKLQSTKAGKFEFQILMSGDIHLRHISENVWAESQSGIWNCNPREDWYSNYDMGMGTTLSARLIFRNRITLGLDIGYAYFGHLSEQVTRVERRTFVEFTPNRQTITIGIKSGMMF